MNFLNDILFSMLQGILHLQNLIHLQGGYGLAIILLTVLLRGALWPLNTAQTRSMKQMQTLQPKLKALQEEYKDNPVKLQEQMMVFYKEHQFNPLGGCLPMLVQLPIFIGLYSMLISPDFLSVAGAESFGPLKGLSHTLQSHAGSSKDGSFSIQTGDRFIAGKHIQVTFTSGTQQAYPIKDAHKVLIVEPKPLIPGDAITLRLDPQQLGEQGFPEAFIKKIKSATIPIMNDVTKELETITLVPQAPVATEAVIDSKNPNPSALAWTLGQSIPTKAGTKHIDWSVFGLIVIYALLTIAYQKLMTPPPAATDANDPQAKVMKLLPLVFVGVLFFIPMPAGVLLYLVVTMALMFLQTALVNGQEDRKAIEKAAAKAPASQVVDIRPSSAS